MTDESPVDTYPVDVVVPYPERSSRVLALLGLLFFLKFILILPHIFIIQFVAFVSFLLAGVAFVVVVIRGKYPRGIFNFQVRVLRWQAQINAWGASLTDRYPPLLP